MLNLIVIATGDTTLHATDYRLFFLRARFVITSYTQR